MHTGTASLLFVHIETRLVVGMATYPNMGGPGKIDHGPVFQQFKNGILQFENDDDNIVFPSRYFSCDVEIHTKIMFIIQDQPERRQASCLLGGIQVCIHSMVSLVISVTSNYHFRHVKSA
jgi:hypothetical protein